MQPKALKFQLVVLLLMLIIGLVSDLLGITQTKSYESENIVEWNFSLLMTLYFAGMIYLWKDYRVEYTKQ
jgi:nitrate reductase gamma subunit